MDGLVCYELPEDHHDPYHKGKHCYFKRGLIDYMDHDNCPMTLKRF